MSAVHEIWADLRPPYAAEEGRPFSVWHIDKVFQKIAGRHHYLWRAVDAEGEVIAILLQSKRDRYAAVNCCRSETLCLTPW